MKEFMKDYIGVCKHHVEFHKKHWKAEVIVNAVTVGLILVVPPVINCIEDRKKNSGKEKESCK